MGKHLAITTDLYWVGALDPNLRVFDIVMETEFGTTYNSYVLKGSDGIAVFETVKEKFFDDYLANLKTIISPSDIRYIVVNHTEPDHAGSAAKLLEYAPNATIVGSQIAISYMKEIMNKPFNSQSVKDGEMISLGNKTIRFISAPSLHWPDSMYSYIEEDHVLVTCDSFGAHYSDERILRSSLDDSCTDDYLTAYKYYYDMIMGPFKPFVLKALDKIEDLKLDFICPGHGMVLDASNMNDYMDLYRKWSTPQTREIPSIVIPYVSAYGYTEKLAYAIKKGIESTGLTCDVLLFNLVETSVPEVLKEVSMAKGLLVGSCTILADALPPIWQLLTSLNPIINKGLYAGCFGSYGWSGEATKYIAERLRQLKFHTPLEPFAIKFNPSEATLKDAEAFGAGFAEEVLK